MQQRRDINILKAFKKEVDLKTRVVRSKKAYTRKVKHKKAFLGSY